MRTVGMILAAVLTTAAMPASAQDVPPVVEAPTAPAPKPKLSFAEKLKRLTAAAAGGAAALQQLGGTLGQPKAAAPPTAPQ